METRTRFATFVASTLACAAVLFAPAASAGERNVSLRFAGTGSDLALEATPGGTSSQVTTAAVRGTFGNSELVIRTEWSDYIIEPADCAAGFGVKVTLINSTLVITAADHSQVFGFSTDGWMCVNATNGAYYGEMKGVYYGGTGRFEGASGSWTAKYDGFTLDRSVGFRSIRGSADGTLILP